MAQLAAAGHDVLGLSRADRFDVREKDAFRVEHPIDALIVNAGVQNRAGTLAELDFPAVLDTFDVNALGPMRVLRALLPNLRHGHRRLVVFLSSRMGSFGEYGGANMYAYRASKAALNMFVRCVADELGPEGFCCVALHPGWVRTDMGGIDATLSPEESVRGMLNVLGQLDGSANGQFLDQTGQKLPW